MNEPVRPGAVAVNFALSPTGCLATGSFIHPWWLYVAARPGAVLGVPYAAGIGRPPDADAR